MAGDAIPAFYAVFTDEDGRATYRTIRVQAPTEEGAAEALGHAEAYKSRLEERGLGGVEIRPHVLGAP